MNTSITLPEGNNTLRVKIVIGDFNLNWINFKDIILGIEGSSIEEYGFYPNPASDIISVLNSKYDHYRILSLQGKIIASNNILSDGQLDISQLQAGHYFIILTQSESTFRRTFKLIVR